MVDSWWHGLPVATTPIGAEGMHAADAAADNLAAAGLRPAAAAALPDPAAEGYIWQLGGSGGAANPANQQRQQEEGEWGGLCSGTTAAGIASSAALLYSDPGLWASCQQRGFQLLHLLYDRERNLGQALGSMAAVQQQLEERRAVDFAGGMLWQQQLRATEYFSRWIELKEGLKNRQ